MASLRDAALLLFDTLDQLGIHYAVGGSFASSFHGIARATQDLDLVVEQRAKILNHENSYSTSNANHSRMWASDTSNLTALRREITTRSFSTPAL